MSIKLILGTVSTILAIAGTLPYLINVLAKKTTPHIYTWLVWGIIQATSAIAMIINGAGFGSWPIIIGALSCFLIFLLSFKYGTKNITKFDTLCLILAIISIIIWIIQKNPLITVILLSVIDTLGFIPTYRKAYIEPQSETLSAFVICAAAYFFGILALQDYSVITAFYLITIFISNFVFVALIFLRRKALKKA